MQQPVTGEQGDGGFKIKSRGISKDKHNRSYKFILTMLKILAGLGMLILSIQGIHWENLVAGIRSADLSWLSLAILSVVLGLFLKFWRWVTMVRNYQIRSTVGRLYSAYFVGQAVNIILPLRGGELVRIGYFAGEPKILPEIASTIILEKYLDLMALTVYGLLVSYKISLDNILNLGSWLLPLTVIMTILLLAAILFGPTIWGKIQAGKFLPERVIDWIDRWVQASQWLRNPKQVFPAVLMTILIWGVMWLTNLLLFRSLGLPLGGTAAGLVLILVYVGLIPALMPGNIGPFYFFARLAVLPFGILHDQALVFAVLLHFIVTVPALIGGLTGLVIRSDRAVSA
jgi:glycosyltransferase 2 family protein